MERHLLLTNQVNETHHFNDDGSVVFETDQHIGDDYFENMKQMQEEFSFRLNGLTPVASIPEAVINRWLREGFDFWNETASAIQKKLKSESMEGMMATQKTF